MPHFLTSRERYMPAFLTEICSGLKTPSRRESASFAYLIEALDLTAAIIFTVGSVCFLPKYSKDVDVFVTGCNLFVVGSVQYVLITCLTLAEALNEKGTWTLEAVENGGWVLGSVVFLIGTILYFPDRMTCTNHVMHSSSLPDSETCSSLAQHMNEHSKAFFGTIFFIIGSMIFVVAVFFNAMNQRKFTKWKHRMVSYITFNYMIGSLLFCMGSVAFLPDVGCGPEMVKMGAWLFIIGSAFFILGSLLSLWRTYEMLNVDEEDSEEPLNRKLEEAS